MRTCGTLVCLIVACTCLAICAIGQEHAASPNRIAYAVADNNTNDASSAKRSSAGFPAPSAKETAAVESAMRVEGEKRFRTNCGRCHMAPHKFPPRVMATAIRHMRVRATLTDEDMRFILLYMTQ